MSGNSGGRDKKEARMIAIVLVVLVLLLFAAGFLLIPSVADFVQVYLLEELTTNEIRRFWNAA